MCELVVLNPQKASGVDDVVIGAGGFLRQLSVGLEEIVQIVVGEKPRQSVVLEAEQILDAVNEEEQVDELLLDEGLLLLLLRHLVRLRLLGVQLQVLQHTVIHEVDVHYSENHQNQSGQSPEVSDGHVVAIASGCDCHGTEVEAIHEVLEVCSWVRSFHHSDYEGEEENLQKHHYDGDLQGVLLHVVLDLKELFVGNLMRDNDSLVAGLPHEREIDEGGQEGNESKDHECSHDVVYFVGEREVEDVRGDGDGVVAGDFQERIGNDERAE